MVVLESICVLTQDSNMSALFISHSPYGLCGSPRGFALPCQSCNVGGKQGRAKRLAEPRSRIGGPNENRCLFIHSVRTVFLRFPLWFAVVALSTVSLHASDGRTDGEGSVLWSLNIGGGADEEALGFGWSRQEYVGGYRFRWMTRLEGDLWVHVDQPGDLSLRLVAAIPHLDWRRQRIGLFVNGRFVTDWQAPDDHLFHAYEADIPASLIKDGENRLTFRTAYRTRIGRDSRRLALAVDTIELRAR